MTPDEKDYLLVEYKASWEAIQNIDNRRDRFASYFALLYGGVTSVVVTVLTQQSPPAQSATLVRAGVIVLVLATVIAGVAILGILRSERDANVRYRQRVNRIREVFLSGDTDPRVAAYFATEHHSPLVRRASGDFAKPARAAA